MHGKEVFRERKVLRENQEFRSKLEVMSDEHSTILEELRNSSPQSPEDKETRDELIGELQEYNEPYFENSLAYLRISANNIKRIPHFNGYFEQEYNEKFSQIEERFDKCSDLTNTAREYIERTNGHRD